MSKNSDYIPALSLRFLTPFYDFIQNWIVRDVRYKILLIEQADIQPGHLGALQGHQLPAHH